MIRVSTCLPSISLYSKYKVFRTLGSYGRSASSIPSLTLPASIGKEIILTSLKPFIGLLLVALFLAFSWLAQQ